MRRVLVLAALIVVAVVAWWIVESEPPAPSAPPFAAPAAGPADAKPAQRTVRKLSAAPVEEAKPALPAEPKSGKAPDLTESSGELTVVDGATGEPLAGVQVAFLPLGSDPTTASSGSNALESAKDPIDALLEHGRKFTTDALGRVALPKFEGMAVVGARHGERSGSTAVEMDLPGWRLELRRSTELTVLVTDAAGRPCGDVTVQLVRRAPFGLLSENATTDATGTARFDLGRDAGGDDSEAPALSVVLPVAERRSVAIDVRRPPTETVRLELPPTGRVRCEVVDETGAATVGSHEVTLRLADEAASRVPFDDTRETLADGTAVFPYVGLGLELELEIAAVDASRVSSKQRFAGPVRAGEETVVRVTLGGRRPSVVGRLVDKAGAPVAGIEITANIVEPGRFASHLSHQANESTTDESGRFRFAFDRAPGDAGSAKLEIGRRVISSPTSWSRRRVALLDLPVVLPSGDVDVGDVVFTGAELLVAGVVVDASGNPLAEATVRAMETDQGTIRSPVRDVDAVTTDEAGRFRLEGESAGSPQVLVGVDLEGWYAPNDARFAVGSTDARVVMALAGGIAGSVRVPEGVEVAQIVVAGPPADNGDGDHRFHGEGLTVQLERGGRFEVRTLRPGKARVSLELGWNSDDTVLTIEDVEVVAGEITRDPRLQDIDPAKSLQALTVSVRDADEKPLAGATVHFRPSGGLLSWKRSDPTDARGVATIPARSEDVSAGGVDLAVTCPGYRSRSIARATAGATVVLERAKASTVRVRLASGCPVPDPPHYLAVSLDWIEPGAPDGGQTHDDPRGIAGRGGETGFGKDRVVTFQTYDAGRYRVVLMLWKMDMSGGGGSGMATVPEVVTVNVPGDGTTVEVEVGFDPQELRRQMDRKH